MAKLTYTPCKCIKRGDCILPGTRGNLSIVTKGKITFVRKCKHCGG